MKFGTTSGNYTQSSITQNETSSPKTWYYKITYNGLTSSGSFTQESGPCTPPTCTESDEWDDKTFSVSVVGDVDKCDTYAKFNVTVSGKHINSDCSTSTTSVTLSASDYTVLYGETNGNYTSSTFNANETNQAKTWYYKLSGKGAHSNLSKTGSFIQSAGPCTAPTCTEKNEWDNNTLSVSVVGDVVGKCDTSATFEVTVSGIHTNSDCSTSDTSATLSTSDYTVLYGETNDNYNLSSFKANETNQQKTLYYKLSGKGVYSNLSKTGSFTQLAGPCTEPTCTEKNEWNENSMTVTVKNTTVSACSTSNEFEVYLEGIHTYSDCTTASTSTTIDNNNYVVKYGTTSGNCNLDYYEKNETNQPKTWYYKLTNSSEFGNFVTIGSFYQEAGPCTTVYVMQLTSGNTATSATFPGETESIGSIGYIYCYSTKNGVKQNVTVSSNVDWLTVEENNDLPYSGANFNFRFTQTENTSTSARTGFITITQAESNKTVEWKIVQKGAIVLTNNCATVSVKGRKWTITLPYAAASDVTYTFNAVNGYSGGEDWTQTMTVLKGATTATANTTQYQFATSESEFSSVSPTEDDTYIYSDCDIHVESDWNDSCDCEQASITCDPTYAYLDYNSGSTVSTNISAILPSSECNRQWIATDDSGGFVASGLTDGTITRSVTGTVTVHLAECQEKTAKFNVYYSRVDLITDIDTTRQCPPPVNVEVVFSQYSKNGTHIADYTNSTSVSLNPEDKFNVIVKLTGTTADSGCNSRAIKIEIRSGQTLQYETLYNRVEIGEEIIDTNATSINPFYGGGITVYIYTP